MHQQAINCPVKEINNQAYIRRLLAQKIDKAEDEIFAFRIRKRSLDARGKEVQYHLQIDYSLEKNPLPENGENFKPKDVHNAQSVYIAGMGPAGIFAALGLIQNGLKPIILEQGKSVDERKKDIALLHREGTVNPKSNYAFGEGGAGTYSDGKLYTRSKKRGDLQYILNVLHQFGASEDILMDTHAHVGTDKLSGIIKNIRQAILDAGGEIHFNTAIKSFLVSDNQLKGIVTENDDKIPVERLILATGHSATSIYEWLDNNNFPLEFKNFAMGVRIEHPQELINQIRYGKSAKSMNLPPAEYSAAVQTETRGVYSFCMCPGGHVIPAMTSNNTLLVNGMSNSQRNSEWANAGLVTEVKAEDIYAITKDESALSGLRYQQALESLAFKNSGNGISAPAQRVADFCHGKISAGLPKSSYSPGIISSPMHFWMPDFIVSALQTGIQKMNNPLHGFLTNEAIILGLESRTSSPVRIPRNRETMEYLGFSGMFPVGEGAGYAGGIVSSAIDGLNAAKYLAQLKPAK
jgi:uncharacterized protein